MVSLLDSSDQTILNNASSFGIIKQFDRIKEYNEQGRWLGPRNHYRSDPIARLNSEAIKPKYPRQLADYVAASSPLHLWDGWNYLGLALYSCICGYTNNAIHLAYYAELRAAMSLLASQGIGIFNNRNCVVDDDSKIHYFTKLGGTHKATWSCLQWWANREDTWPLLDRVLQIQSSTFVEWLGSLPQSGAWSPLGTELLLSMGLDLKRMAEDRNARNEASYRPSGFVVTDSRNPMTDIEFVVDSIRLLEPGGPSEAFINVDKYIFRRVVHRALETGNGEDRRFQENIEYMVSKFIDDPILRKEWRQFLTYESDYREPRLIEEAENQKDHHDANYHLQVIGRALLLLRVATGIVRKVFDDSDVDLNSLEFWWREAGYAQGFWDIPPDSISSSQLWDDLSSCLDDIADWIKDYSNSRQNFLTDCAGSLVQITGMARFALIGLVS